MNDSLGVCAELDAATERHRATYRCVGKEMLDDPERLRRFRTFVNSDHLGGDIVTVPEREQHWRANEWEQVAIPSHTLEGASA